MYASGAGRDKLITAGNSSGTRAIHGERRRTSARIKGCTRYERLAHVMLVLLLTGQRRGELAPLGKSGGMVPCGQGLRDAGNYRSVPPI